MKRSYVSLSPVVIVNYPTAARNGDSMHRVVARANSPKAIREALEAILADPKATRIGQAGKRKFGPRAVPVIKADDERIPGT
jgi:hypothetical protein